MPREEYRTPAKFWPTIEALVKEALERLRRHQEAPEVAQLAPNETHEWREGDMIIQLLDGPEAKAVHDADRQLQAAVNLLALLVSDGGGVVRIPRARLEAMQGLKLSSFADGDFQVLKTEVTENAGRKILLPGRDFL